MNNQNAFESTTPKGKDSLCNEQSQIYDDISESCLFYDEIIDDTDSIESDTGSETDPEAHYIFGCLNTSKNQSKGWRSIFDEYDLAKR